MRPKRKRRRARAFCWSANTGTPLDVSYTPVAANDVTGRIPDYQIAALLMAVLLRGLERQELAALTDAMLASGDRLSFEGFKVPRIDNTGRLTEELTRRFTMD